MDAVFINFLKKRYINGCIHRYQREAGMSKIPARASERGVDRENPSRKHRLRSCASAGKMANPDR